MARQSLGKKKINRYIKLTGLPIINAFVRGGTDHRIDLFLADGSVVYLLKDNTIIKPVCDL